MTCRGSPPAMSWVKSNSPGEKRSFPEILAITQPLLLTNLPGQRLPRRQRRFSLRKIAQKKQSDEFWLGRGDLWSGERSEVMETTKWCPANSTHWLSPSPPMASTGQVSSASRHKLSSFTFFGCL